MSLGLVAIMAGQTCQPGGILLPCRAALRDVADGAVPDVLREDYLTGHVGIAGVHVLLVLQVRTPVHAMDSGGDGLGAVAGPAAGRGTARPGVPLACAGSIVVVTGLARGRSGLD